MVKETQYDVFLSHNSQDKPAVERLARRLTDETGLRPFLDKWHLVPGEPWQEALEEALDQSRTCAVFLGPAGLGTWENEEMRAALDIRASTPDFRVIPVLLPGARLPERGRLPRFLARHTWVDFRPGLDDADAFHRLVCGIQGVAPGPEGATEAEAVCPFRGLQVFDEEHACFFFGREALTQHLVEQLREDRFLAVIGPSGSGKSSLVRAGLVPQVRAGTLPASNRWPIVLFKPGPHPLQTLAAQLLPHLDGGADPLAARGSLLDALAKDERGLHGTVQVALASAPDSLRLLLVVDQFEELFTLCHDESARAKFIANLLYASAIAGGQTVAVVTMRADFFGKCAAYPDLAARLAERDVLVGPMSEEELRRAIESPAEAVGLHYEKGLVDTILSDLGNEPGTLPLLQHTLLELWERRRGGWLTTDAYRQIGGVQGALAQRADQVYARLTPVQQEAARRVMLRLTQPGEGTEDTRRRVRKSELLPTGEQAEQTEAVIQALADARLVTTTRDMATSEEQVDVSHEALIRGWSRLREWIDEDRAGLRTHRRLTEVAIEWERNHRDESYLYRGARLAEAEEWAEAHADDPNPLEREFLEASVGAREAERIAARQRVQRVIVGLVTGLVIISALAVFAWERSQLAEQGRVYAENAKATAQAEAAVALSRQLAVQSANQLEDNKWELAMLLAIEAGRTADTAEAFAALRQAFAHPGRTLVILGYAAEWNADESRILTASADGTARVWDAQTGAELVTLSHEGSVWKTQWNADESRILTRSEDGTARVWDAETGAELVTLSHEGSVYQAQWNADESRILTASYDGRARVWDAETGAELVTLSHGDAVWEAQWNADESRILTQSDDGTARVWDAETGAELVTLSHGDRVTQAQWNADESRILTRSDYGTARVWDAETGAELVTLSHEGWVYQAQWNADESRILTASADRTARVWDAETGGELVTLSHEDTIYQAQWNADESRILTASEDGTARVWDAETGAELVTLSHGDSVSQAQWNADESRILTAGCDRRDDLGFCEEGTARVWDAETGVKLVTLSHGDVIYQAQWNADESRILTASEDGTVRQWYTRMEDLLEAACQRAPRNMTEVEWRRFMGSEPYGQTCPNLPPGD
jgi:WD40 repeat protein/energy-coupling factor transporter ATP-binding protein EcfA2